MAASHLLLRVESNVTTGTGGWRRPPPLFRSTLVESILRMSSAAGSATDSPRDQVRRAMRMRRRDLTDKQYAQAARDLARVVSRQGWLRPGRRIAIYLPFRRELDTRIVMRMALQRRCRLYVPLVTNLHTHRMEFVRLNPGERLRRNRLGIHEPPRHAAERIPVRELDLILLPLLAVDERGWRLGSGAGFYDRRLNHLRAGRRWRKPRLIGVAYEFQRVPRLEPAPWDVPLDAVVTERALYVIPSHSLPGIDRGFS